ncbi:hypothetical protein [Acinetobacter faecalis]|uniref:hypothetical protein n=1 Tax=Acinetobacter faecalis TaxID=2665161 RepID=UPI002A913877|nr:hypothetical protein [Acinetobacter faecalis]MDY6456181.1 hypothetical protein [Acinetobacter faecalis]
MDIKLQISKDLDYIVSIRLDSYLNNSLIGKYFLYIDRYTLLETKLRQIVQEIFKNNPDLLKNKNFRQLVDLLKDHKECSELFQKLTIAVDYKNKIHEIFSVDKIISKSMGQTITNIDEKHLNDAIYELEHVLILCEWSFIKISLL